MNTKTKVVKAIKKEFHDVADTTNSQGSMEWWLHVLGTYDMDNIEASEIIAKLDEDDYPQIIDMMEKYGVTWGELVAIWESEAKALDKYIDRTAKDGVPC